MSKDKIFGMLIPPEYNGIRFNTHAGSQIVQKLSSCNGAVGVVAMVPTFGTRRIINSLWNR